MPLSTLPRPVAFAASLALSLATGAGQARDAAVQALTVLAEVVFRGVRCSAWR